MKYLLTVLVVVACVFAIGECQKKAPKAIKSLRRLCKNSLDDAFTIEDGNYTAVFDDLIEWCPDFMANYSQYFTNKANEGKPYNPVKEMKKVCAYYERKYGDGETLPILEGLGDLCDDFEYAYNVSEGIIMPINVTPDPITTPTPTDAPEPRAIQKLQLLCKKSDKGKLKWRNESYDDAFEALETDFCPDYLTAVDGGATWPYDTRMKERKYKAEKELDTVCGFVEKKFPEGIEEGSALEGLDDVCLLVPLSYA